jgi:hypothetical protein
MDTGFPIFVFIGVLVISAFVYLLFMIFLPEWVGISGKKAQEAERAHRGDPVEDKKPNELK